MNLPQALRRLLAALLCTTGCLSLAAPAGRPRASKAGNAHENEVHVAVEHTIFHPLDNVALLVDRLNGRMVGKPGEIISLDDPNSFSVVLDQAVTRLSARDLSSLLNRYLLLQADSPITHVDVTFDGQQVVLRGKIHKVVDLPFEGRGELSATPNGELRMHLDEFRVAGVLHKGLLSFFGVHLNEVAKPRHAGSFHLEGDDFITPLNALFPPPIVYGHLARVRIEGQTLVQIIGTDMPAHALQHMPKALDAPANYIYFTGGSMRFGRMTMDDVDLKLVDKSPLTPFDFSLKHYQEQIQAGYATVLPSLGLVVYAEDYSTLAHRRR